MKSEAAKIGEMGENVATQWLRDNGYLIVERNWRMGRYELDIIAQRGFSLHIIEVKSRAIGGWTSPEQAMTQSKIQALMRAANGYLASHPTRLEIQFDLIAVDFDINYSPQVRYIPNAIETHW